ncbi:MAG: hypothetical protein LBI02_05660 [Opitutaceae bacterium]|nr:hypothetical protein [Opitutaceae bacterium]
MAFDTNLQRHLDTFISGFGTVDAGAKKALWIAEGDALIDTGSLTITGSINAVATIASELQGIGGLKKLGAHTHPSASPPPAPSAPPPSPKPAPAPSTSTPPSSPPPSALKPASTKPPPTATATPSMAPSLCLVNPTPVPRP